MTAFTGQRGATDQTRWTLLAAALLVLAVVAGGAWPHSRPGIALPPVLSGEEDTLATVQQAHATVLTAQKGYGAAEQQLATGTAAGASTSPEDVAAVMAGGPGAVAALQRATTFGNTLVQLAAAAATYQTALQGYDDALMARSRGLGARSEQLRSATWPFVEFVKRFPPPLGLDTTLHPVSPAAMGEQLARLRSDAATVAAGGATAQAAMDLTQLRLAGQTTITIAGYLPQYQRLLETYSTQVEGIAASPDASAHGNRLALGRAITVVLLLILVAGAGIVVRQPSPTVAAVAASPLALPALAVGLMFGLYLAGPAIPALLAAVGFLVVAVLSPAAAVAGIAASIPFFFHPRAIGHLHFPPAEITLVLTILALALRLLAGRRDFRRRDAFRLSPIDVLALLFLLAGTLSLLVPDRAYLHVALRSYRVVILEPLVWYLLITRLLAGGNGLRRTLDAFIIVLAGVGWLAAAQFLTGSDTWSSGGVARALGVEPSATALGIELGRGAVLALTLALFHPDRRARLGYLLLALPGGAGLLVSFTRGAWIAVGVGGAGAAAVRERWRALAGIVTVGVVVLAVLATSHIERLQGLFSLHSSSNGARLQIWHGALLMAASHPISGIGLDQFLAQDPTRFGIPEVRFLVVSHPHNVLLDAWLQLGLLGAIVSVALVLAGLWTAFRLARGAVSPVQRAWALALVAALTEFVVHGMVDEGYFTGDLALTFWLLLGAIEVLRRDQMVKYSGAAAVGARPA